MFVLRCLLAQIAFVSIANAFYYYEPDYRCSLDHSCDAKRAVEVGAAAGNDDGASSSGLTLRVVQRPSQDKERARSLQGTGTAHLEDRASSYSVVSAAPPSQTNSAGVAQDGTDFSYFVEVLLGSASTPVYLLLDTGASTSWVMGPDCTSDICKSHNSFGSKDSTTFKNLGDPFEVDYAKGSVSGVNAQDTLSIAGLKLPVILGIANITSDDFAHFPIDGILGLSLSKSTSANSPHFWESLVASKAIKANVLGLSLNRNADGPNNGEINFGSLDTSRYTGPMNYYPVSVNDAGNWALPVADAGIGDTKAGVPSRIAYVDTGTTYIFGPKDDVQKLHALIKGATSADGATWTVPCDTTAPATFTFGSNTYSVSSKDWVSPSVNGVCTSNIYGIGVLDSTSWLLGDTFLKNVYAVFDYDQNRFGIAARASSAPTASSSLTSPTGALSSSTTLATALVPGSLTGATQSNGSPAGSSGPKGTQAATATSSPPTGPNPGLHGKETSVSGQSAAAQTSAPSATPAKSAAAHPVIGFSTILLAASTLVALLLV